MRQEQTRTSETKRETPRNLENPREPTRNLQEPPRTPEPTPRLLTLAEAAPDGAQRRVDLRGAPGGPARRLGAPRVDHVAEAEREHARAPLHGRGGVRAWRAREGEG